MANRTQDTMEGLLDDLISVLEEGFSIPFGGGKRMVDTQECLAIIDDLRDLIPDEIRRARAIIDDREHILNDARAEAESMESTAKKRSEAMVAAAEQKAESIVNEQEIVRRAAAKANELEKKGQEEYKNRINASYDYVEDFLRQTDEAYAENLEDLRRVRQNIKENRRKEIKNL